MLNKSAAHNQRSAFSSMTVSLILRNEFVGKRFYQVQQMHQNLPYYVKSY
jgi:hypothetical protein